MHMAAENSSVIRILKLYELLRQETVENNPMLGLKQHCAIQSAEVF